MEKTREKALSNLQKLQNKLIILRNEPSERLFYIANTIEAMQCLIEDTAELLKEEVFLDKIEECLKEKE